MQGKAGTGKSALIRSICHLLDSHYGPGSRVYEVLAPTGAAAINVDGMTIHSCLKIPTTGRMLDLNGEVLRSFQLRFKDIKFLIVDEYSMIGLRLLHKIHQRLAEAKGNTNEEFGGFFIYFFGDIRQLPPVKDTAIYMQPSDDNSYMGARLVQSIQKKVILETCFRQSDDQANFRNILDSIATGAVNQNGWNQLMQRRMSIRADERDSFSNAVRLYPTTEQVRDYNNDVLARNQSPVALIEASHNNATAMQGSDLQAQNLSRTLYLSENCRVMLRRNLCVQKGLVNGSLGVVRNIVYLPGMRPPALPALLLVEFDKYQGPFIRDRSFPVLPVTSRWKEHSTDCSRKQFPLNPAYALTIHKAQGLTLDKAIVDIGAKEAAPGMTYVASSRVRRINDLILSRSFDFSRLAMIGRMKHVIEREKFMANLVQDAEQRE